MPRSRPEVAAALAALTLSLAAGQARAEAAPEGGAELPPQAQVTLHDAALVDQDGREVRLASQVVGDRIAVVDFVFTSCTTICPILSSRLARVQERLGDRLGREVVLVTVSLDPARDTPARLKEFAGRFQAGLAWSWLTGTPASVERALKGFGAYAADVTRHAPVILVGDGRTGRWSRFSGFPEPERLVAAVDAFAAARPQASRPVAPATAVAAVSAAADPRAAKARAWFTDTVLRDQDGRPVRFFSDVLEGQVVCLGFIFTRCDGACPLIMQKLARTREALGDRAGAVRMVLVSVDPEHDGPAELKGFAAKHGAGAGYTFLTGAPADVQRVLRQLGQVGADPAEHSTALLAGYVRSAHWTRLRPDAPPQAVAEILRGLAEEGAGVASAAP